MRTLKPKTNKQLAVIRSSCFYILMPAHRAHALLPLSLSLSFFFPLFVSLSAPRDLRYFSCRRMPVKRHPRISCLIFEEPASIFCPWRFAFRVSPPFRKPSASRLRRSNFVLWQTRPDLVRIFTDRDVFADPRDAIYKTRGYRVGNNDFRTVTIAAMKSGRRSFHGSEVARSERPRRKEISKWSS